MRVTLTLSRGELARLRVEALLGLLIGLGLGLGLGLLGLGLGLGLLGLGLGSGLGALLGLLARAQLLVAHLALEA